MTGHQEHRTDVLIVGSGAAALRAALEADAAGADVLVVIKGGFRRSGATFHSVAEVGAFNVPDNAGDNGDSPSVFLDDILTAGQGMADPRLSAVVAEEAEEALQYLEAYGVPFEREGDAYLVFRACFSSRARSHVIKDHFKPIVKALGSEATRRGISVRDRLMVTDLIAEGGACHGVTAVDFEGVRHVIRAKAVILTTGGASQLFARNLYPAEITGDGYAMAHRAGARLVNMEFMQAGVSVVHPFVNLFGNYLWDGFPNLTDRESDPVLDRYVPEGIDPADVIAEKERHFPFSARDISRYVEISIQKAINEGHATDEGGVYMDFIGKDIDAILQDRSRSFARMWPVTQSWYEERGVNLRTDKIQIACAAHAINGGILIDTNGESSLDGLYAAGEVAGGPHGADRLGGNMSVTCQVFGKRAGRAAAARAATNDHADVAGMAEAHDAQLAAFNGKGDRELADLRSELQKSANRNLLILRSELGLKAFLDDCAAIRNELAENCRVETSEDLVHALELNNLCEVGTIMATAARLRRESRGSHYREDFPQADPNEAANIVFDRRHKDGLFRAVIGALNLRGAEPEQDTTSGGEREANTTAKGGADGR